jgi:signal peptidase II
MQTGKRIGVIMLVLCCCIGCDQATKEMARHSLRDADVISSVGDLFRLQYTENTGAFLGLGSKLPAHLRVWIMIILPGLLLLTVFLVTILSRTIPQREIIALALIVGGGWGNLFDRIWRHGTVIDFMNIGIGALRTGIFNVADVALMVGMGLLILYRVHAKNC